MNKNVYSTEDLRSYLLGNASEYDEELMDELSVADAEFADSLGAAEKDLIDSYVEGGLDDAERKRFEDHYLASALRLDKVRFARAFREYSNNQLGELAAAENGGSNRNSDKHSFLSTFLLFGSQRSVYRFSMAAAAVIVLGLGGWIVFEVLEGSSNEVVSNIGVDNRSPAPSPQVQSPRPPENVGTPEDQNAQPGVELPSPTPSRPAARPPAPPVIASLVLAPPLRSSSVPVFRVPAKASRAAVRLEIESDDFEFYSVELRNSSSGAVIWQRRRVKPSRSNDVTSISVNLPTKPLSPSLYTFRVSGIHERGAAEIVGDYPFRVVR